MHLLRLFVKLIFKFVYCTMVNITSMFRLGLRGDFRLSHVLQLFVKLIFKFFDLYDAIRTQRLLRLALERAAIIADKPRR